MRPTCKTRMYSEERELEQPLVSDVVKTTRHSASILRVHAKLVKDLRDRISNERIEISRIEAEVGRFERAIQDRSCHSPAMASSGTGNDSGKS